MKIPHVSHQPWKPSGENGWRPPRPWRWFPRFIDLIGGFYVRWGLGLEKIQLRGAGILARATADCETDNRLVIVFRHCGDADPQGLWYALNSLARREFRRAGMKRRPRFVFLASAEIALWGGFLADLALRGTGTLPLAHGAGSRPALDYLRQHFRTSADPVVLAPEGQITYELNGPIRLDPGAANMALWAADAAPGAARVLPIGVRYRVPRETWGRWSRFVADLERGVGLPPWSQGEGGTIATRIERLWDRLLDLGEDYYHNHHRREFAPLDDRDARCRRLTETAVTLAAQVRGLGEEPVRSTVFRLRAAALDVVFPRRRDASTLGRALEARAAAEAWWVHRHQELGDLLQCLTPSAFPAEPTLEVAVEAALNLADFAGRLAGGHIDHRPRPFRRELELTVGEPWVVEKATGGHRSRAAAITEKIRLAFEKLRLDSPADRR